MEPPVKRSFTNPQAFHSFGSGYFSISPFVNYCITVRRKFLRLLSFVLDGVEMFSYPDLLESITKEELSSLLDTVFQKSCLSVSVIDPLE